MLVYPGYTLWLWLLGFDDYHSVAVFQTKKGAEAPEARKFRHET
jgi:hypothetical protein